MQIVAHKKIIIDEIHFCAFAANRAKIEVSMARGDKSGQLFR
jgi:hypothetical protein